MTASTKPLEPGDVIDGKLEIVRQLGAGGMGAVYEARNLRTDRLVAVKVLHHALVEDADLVSRVLAEARAGGRVQHPNVVDVVDAGVHEAAPYLVMELLRGESLGQRLHRDGTLAVADATRFVVDAAAGLAAAHALGIVHRDLKPENVFLARSAAGDTVVKVVDFGISKQTGGDDVTTTRTGTVVGTPVYMAPEQARGLRDLDARVDVYGLAAVLYESLAGRPPFVADNYNALIAALLTETPRLLHELRPDVPAALAHVVARALSRDREDRYATITDFAVAITDAAAGMPSLAATQLAVASLSPSRSVTSPSRRRRWASAALAVVALTVTVAFVWHPWRNAGRTAVAHADVMALPAIDRHRVAIVPTQEPGAHVDGRLAWALASRLVEELDRYQEFRPTSPAGLLAARMTVLGDPLGVPDEVQAARIAGHLRAGTIVSLSETETADGIRVATHVYDEHDLSNGRSVPALALTRASLDGDGPATLAERVADALRLHFGLASLTGTMGADADTPSSFSAFETYLDSEHAFLEGDYATAVDIAQRAIDMDPEEPLFYCALACALSYGETPGADEQLRHALERAKALRGRVRQRHTKLVVDQDILWGETEIALRDGRRDVVAANSRQLIEYDLELANQYGDPVGYLYAGAVTQYLLADAEGARRYYATARERSPSLYPAYYEEAKLMRGNGTSRAGNEIAARMLFTYIECNPRGSRLAEARGRIRTWHLVRPHGVLKCPGG